MGHRLPKACRHALVRRPFPSSGATVQRQHSGHRHVTAARVAPTPAADSDAQLLDACEKTPRRDEPATCISCEYLWDLSKIQNRIDVEFLVFGKFHNNSHVQPFKQKQAAI